VNHVFGPFAGQVCDHRREANVSLATLALFCRSARRFIHGCDELLELVRIEDADLADYALHRVSVLDR
jgi:hypothetical protein